MLFILLMLFSALFVEGIGTYVSVVGLGHTFNMDPVIITFAIALDLCKVVGVSFLYKYWKETGITMKAFLVPMMAIAMLVTSTGVAGYLTKSFQGAIVTTSQDAISINALEDEKTRLQSRKLEIDKQIANLPADYAKARRQLMQEFAPETDRINSRLAAIDVELPKLKVEGVVKSADLGPILYVAQAFDTTPEKAVKWVILLLVFVFDPLAITLLIAANFLIERRKQGLGLAKPTPAPIEHVDAEQIDCGTTIASPGWYCSRRLGHEGSCAAWPIAHSNEAAAAMEEERTLADVFPVTESDPPVSDLNVFQETAMPQDPEIVPEIVSAPEPEAREVIKKEDLVAPKLMKSSLEGIDGKKADVTIDLTVPGRYKTK